MYFRSIKMMELCRGIASNLGLFNDEEITVRVFIGVFYDIRMFSNKYKNFHTLEDNTDSIADTIGNSIKGVDKAYACKQVEKLG